MASAKDICVAPEDIAWPWKVDKASQEYKFIRVKLKENHIKLSYYESLIKDSTEHKACSRMLSHLIQDKNKNWLMLGSQSLDKLYMYAHLVSTVFAFSTMGSVAMYDPAMNPALLDCDPSDEEVFYLWKGMLLVLVNGTQPLVRKYRQLSLNNLLLKRAATGGKVLWLETYHPIASDTSATIFQSKLNTLREIMPNVAGNFYNSGSFLWLKTKQPKELTCADMEA